LPSIATDQDRIFEDCARSFASTGTAIVDALRDSSLLVTGASGFVGSWLLSTLTFLNDVHGFRTRVHAVARYPSRVEQRVPFLAGRKDITWTAADVRQLVGLPDDVAWVVHTAGVPDSRHHATSPIETASVIGEGTFRILRLAEQATGLRRILHLSSGLVDVAAGQHRLAGPGMAYIEAKRFSETLCYAFRTQAKLPIVITRPFTLLGPFQGLDSPWAANNFLHAALEGQPLKIRGDGQAVRSYLYGSDMAVLALAQMTGGESGDVYDLGGIEAMSVADLAQLVAAQARRPLEVRINAAARSVADDRFVPDMRRSVDLGVSPAFSTAQAVARSLAWYAR
jgi:dTDP-glucose 4,6-dehydratase